ncbi:MAG: YbaK/EbsC family protein [Desulfobacter sp.]
MRASAERVQAYFREKGFEFEVRELGSSTRTAGEAAESIGCRVAQIAKSLVFRDKNSNAPILVIASGVNRVDVKKIETAMGCKLGRADATYVREQTGFAIGGIPPAGHIRPLKTVLDTDLKQYREIWAAAGTPFAVFRLNPGDLGSLTGGTWVDLAG